MNRERFRRTAGPLSVETSGKTVEDAVQAALGRLRARRDEVEVEVLQEGRGGLFGIGSREARVRVRRPDRSDPRTDNRVDRRPSSAPGDSGGRRGVTSSRRSSEDIERLEREVERHRTARGGPARETRPSPMAPVASARPAAPAGPPRRREPMSGPADSRPPSPRPDSGAPRRRSPSGGRPPYAGRSEQRPMPPRAVVSVPGPTDVPAPVSSGAPASVEPSILADFASGILTRMGYRARVEASYADEAYEVRIDAGEHNEILIGKKGETLDALQHVLAKMASRGMEELLRVRVDIAEYRQKRSSELSDRALEMAKEVVATGKEVITEPLPAAERRSIHRALSDHPEVTTQSLGDGQVKPVWIGLKTATPPQAEISPVVVRRGGSSRPPSRTSSEDRRREDRTEPTPVTESASTGDTAAPLPARSLIDPWESLPGNKDKQPANEPAPEWGRRPKPARGRRK